MPIAYAIADAKVLFLFEEYMSTFAKSYFSGKKS